MGVSQKRWRSARLAGQMEAVGDRLIFSLGFIVPGRRPPLRASDYSRGPECSAAPFSVGQGPLPTDRVRSVLVLRSGIVDAGEVARASAPIRAQEGVALDEGSVDLRSAFPTVRGG